MERVFNLGIGMCAVVPGNQWERALDVVRESGHHAWVAGDIVDGRGRVHIDRVA
jgi:phosphoribosylformylglycinamidine cyclo-ligase